MHNTFKMGTIKGHTLQKISISDYSSNDYFAQKMRKVW